MNKLKGASQMVANMLKRDKTPVRTEAAEALLVDVANVESQYTTLQNNLAKEKRRADDLMALLKQAEDFIGNYEYFSENGFSVKRCPSEEVRDKFVKKLQRHTGSNNGTN